MTNKHLTDFEIQQFVLQEPPFDTDGPEHMRSCATCKMKAEHYKLLFDGIKLQVKPIFDFDLAELVAAQLPPVQHKESDGSFFLYSITGVTIFFVSIAGYFFGNNLLRLFGGINLVMTSLIFTTVFSISLIFGVDMYKRYQSKMEAINYY